MRLWSQFDESDLYNQIFEKIFNVYIRCIFLEQ